MSPGGALFAFAAAREELEEQPETVPDLAELLGDHVRSEPEDELDEPETIPDLADIPRYDAARPWAVPFDPEGKSLLEIATLERSRNLRWLVTLPGLRLVATAWRRRLEDPTTWIGLQRLLGADRGDALPLAKEYARAQEQRQALLEATPAPAGPGFRARGLDPDDGPRIVRAFQALLVRHEQRFAPTWAATAGDCPDARGWAGVLETLPGEVRQWSVDSAALPGLATELGVPVRPMLEALRRERRLVVRPGTRVAMLNGVRTPRGRRRCYRFRDCAVGSRGR
jgi:hypothetical protein